MKVTKTGIIAFVLLLVGLAVQAQTEPVAFASERASLSKSISVYPNPATEFVEVDLDYLDARKVKVALYNIIGNEIAADTEVIDDHKIRVRVKDFASGYYLLTLRDEETRFKGTYKFLKR